MSAKSSYSSPSPAVQQISNEFRRTGWVSLWAQVVLVIISSIILFVATTAVRAPVQNPLAPGVPVPQSAPNPSSGFGGLFSLLSILAMLFTIYWSFRYVIVGRHLRREAPARPKKTEVTRMIWTGLLASLSGMFLGILGTFAIVGTIAVIAFRQSPGFVGSSFTQFVNSLDILVVQASMMLILAHFIALTGSLWLFYRMYRQ